MTVCCTLDAKGIPFSRLELEMKPQPYLFGQRTDRIYPLQDHLPEYHRGVVSSWLDQNLPPGSWILCPFGSSPQIALEAARAGYRVLVPVHNPVLRLLIDNLAHPPTRELMTSALVALGSSYKGQERLKPFILSLYETDCPQCGRETPAAAFTWSAGGGELLSKTCRCSGCGEESVTDVTAEDISKASGFTDRSPTYARALTRVTSPSDPIRIQVERALATYPPRSVYALFTILNKLTGFDLPPEQRKALEALLLHAFYRCSQPQAFGGSENGDTRGRAAAIEEVNVWFALEAALEIWAGADQTLPLATWPEEPPESGGVCVYPGRSKDLILELAGRSIRGLVMVYPTPQPAFWGLSALWTGWLWGQEAAAPLRGILSVKTYDWAWMSRAVETTLGELAAVLPGDTPVLGLIPGAEPTALVSSAASSLTAGLELLNLALDPDQKLAQTQWKLSRTPEQSGPTVNLREQIRGEAFDQLQSAGEPLPKLALYGAGLARLAQAGFPGEELEEKADQLYSQLIETFEETIAYRQGFLHYPGIDANWHLDLELDPLPLSDRVEKSLVTLLVREGGPLPETALFEQIYLAYPGLATPRSGFIQACLHSYGHHPAGDPRAWKLNQNDQPARRLDDLAEIETILLAVGEQLGFSARRVAGPENIIHLTWSEGDALQDSFYISVSALLNKITTGSDTTARRRWAVLPGSRAGLVHYKLNLNPVLAEEIQENWGLLKFRHLRRLVQQGDLTRENYLERFQLDPFTSDSPQLLLI